VDQSKHPDVRTRETQCRSMTACMAFSLSSLCSHCPTAAAVVGFQFSYYVQYYKHSSSMLRPPRRSHSGSAAAIVLFLFQMILLVVVHAADYYKLLGLSRDATHKEIKVCTVL